MLDFPTATSARQTGRPLTSTPVSFETSFLVPNQNKITPKEENFFQFTTDSMFAVDEPEKKEKEKVVEQPVSQNTKKIIPPIPENYELIVINPKELKFIPEARWENAAPTDFRSLQFNYFPKRSSKKLRFEHKLWNALLLTKDLPFLYHVIGVIWETNSIIKVDVNTFAKLLGISKATSALCSPQGSFPSHGFCELTQSDLDRYNITTTENERFYEHESGNFRSDSTPKDLEKCKWTAKNKNMGHMWENSSQV